MFHKDTLRLIKKTYKRFLSIFLMVLIGVGFMVGLMSSAPTLQYSVNDYYDEQNYMDLQLYSSYGFDDDDIKDIEATTGVKDVSGSKFQDVFAVNEASEEYVTRIQEMDLTVNKIELVSGRMPKNPQEAVVLDSPSFGNSFAIGDTIRLYLDDDSLSDKVKYDEYTIVGTVKSPQYMASTKETSTLKNLNLETIIYVANDDLISEYYTSIFLTLDGSEECLAFSSEYESLVDERLDTIEIRFDELEENLKNEIFATAEDELIDAQKTLDENKEEAEQKFADAEKELQNAYDKLIKGEAEIKDNEKIIAEGEKELASNRVLLDENKAAIDKAIIEIETASGMSFDELSAQIKDTYVAYNELSAQKQALINANEAIDAQVSGNNIRISAIEEELTLLDPSEDAEQIATLNAEKEQLSGLNTSLASQKLTNQGTIAYLEGMMAQIDSGAMGSIEVTYNNIVQIENGLSEIESGYQLLDEKAAELAEGKAAIEEAKAEIEDGYKQHEDGLKELDHSRYDADIEFEKAQSEIDKGYQDLVELPSASWTILDRDSQYSSYMFKNTVGQMTRIGYIFPLLFFLVAALVSMTTMTRLIDEQRSQIGIFSALGFSRQKIISKYLLYALIASLFGSILGIAVGMPIFPTVIYVTWRLMYDLPAMNVVLLPYIAVLGVLSFTVLILLVTYGVAYKTLKEMPSQLMRPKAPKNAKKVILEYIRPLWSRLSFTSKITARNIIRYKSRFFMTVIGVAGCTSLLVLGFGIKDSISEIIDIQFGDIFKYNYTVNLEDDYELEHIYEVLVEDTENEQVVPFMEYSSKVYLADDDHTLNVEVYDQSKIASVINLNDAYSEDILSIGEGVIISEKFAKTNNINAGDMIMIESKEGIKAEVKVTGICEMYFQHYLFMSDELYEQVFNEKVHNDKIAVTTTDGTALNDLMNSEEGITSIIDFSSMINQFQTMIKALDIIILVIILAAGSLAFVVLMNLTEVNISERIREIATLKVLGFNNHEVTSYIFKEIFLLTFIGTFLGMPLGKMEQKLVMTVIDMEMVMFGNDIRLISYVYSFFITIIFALIVMLFTNRELRKVEMVESLKSVE